MGERATLTPRFVRVAPEAAHYESTYLVASHPSEPVAVWIRYTVRKPPGGQFVGSIWFTLFEPAGPTAVKVSAPDPHAEAGHLLSVGTHGDIRRDGASGRISENGVQADWDLRFTPTDSELEHLPYSWMYRAPVPRTKSTSPYPTALVDGTVTVSGRSITVQGWRGMVGHNWGSEHAHRWIWLRGAAFADHPDGWLDIVLGRIKVGGLVLPWIANGVVSLDGHDGPRYRVGGPGRRVTVLGRASGCDLVIGGRDAALEVSVAAPLEQSVGWEYADPAGERHQVRNCSAAGLTVDIRPRCGRQPRHSGQGPRTATRACHAAGRLRPATRARYRPRSMSKSRPRSIGRLSPILVSTGDVVRACAVVSDSA